jgi:hypothetical protein
MKAIPSRLPSPAMIVACAALIVALGGVSYAASVLPKNSVGTAQLQKKAVTAAKLAKDAVTGSKVRDRTLTAADFKAGDLPAGPQGPKGDLGAPGPKGDTGAPGPVTGELPSGATVRGIFNVDFEAAAANEIAGGSISFGLRLATEPAVHIIPTGAPSTAACPGSVTNPEAAPGTFCLYENSHANAATLVVCDATCSGDPNASRFGAELFVKSMSADRAFIDGSWAATAP